MTVESLVTVQVSVAGGGTGSVIASAQPQRDLRKPSLTSIWAAFAGQEELAFVTSGIAGLGSKPQLASKRARRGNGNI